jgi:hypothetical protein
MNDRLILGNRVKHATRTDWGLGEVVEDECEGMVTVFFEDVGLKKFNLSIAQFARVEGDEAASEYLTALVNHFKHAAKSCLAMKSGGTTFQKAVENFRSYFPLGFQDPAYLSGPRSEREYKLRAHEFLVEMLGPNVLSQLLADRKYKEVCDRAKAVINKTNLIHQYEKIWLTNGLAKDGTQESFAVSLGTLLYGEQSLQARFEQFSSMLYEINAAKWPIATYFLFLADTSTQIFVKPAVTKSAAEVLGIDINYKPELNWLTYSQVLRLGDAIRLKLIKEGQDDLVPRDMIDVQSFIWVTAPGYF